MVMYDNKFETKKMKLKPRKKLNHNIYIISVKALVVSLHVVIRWSKIYIPDTNFLYIFQGKQLLSIMNT